MNKRTYQAGLTLVELMIALVLGLLLTLGVSQLFVGSRETFRQAEVSARLQESGRIAQEILNKAIRNADYWGCIKNSRIQIKLDTTHPAYDPASHDFANISGVQVQVAGGGGPAVPGSHVLILSGTDSFGIELRKPMNNASAVLDVTHNTGLNVGDILLLSDCSDGAVFEATMLPSVSGEPKIQHNTGSGAPGNAKGGGGPGCMSVNCFQKAFTSGSIYRPYIRRYEVRTNAAGQTGLFMIEGANTFELVEDVVDMRIQVGEANAPGSTTVGVWKDAGTAGINFNNVLALRVSLLVRTPEDRVARDVQQLCFPAWANCTSSPSWTAPDRRRYAVYTTTSAVRNRLIPAVATGGI